MKCPACHAQNKPAAPACGECGRSLEAGTPKKTIMGFPAVIAQVEQPPADPSRGHTNRRALFGVEEDTEEPGQYVRTGLGEETSEPQFGSAVDGSTRVAPQSVVEAAISGSFPMSFELSKAGDDASKPGAKGHPDSELRSTPPGEGFAQDPFSHVWGLDEESSEAVSGSTQVAGASLAHAIMESKHGEISFSKASTSGRKQQNTLMGINLDLYQEDKDSTRPIDRDKLARIRGSVTSKTQGIPPVDFDAGDQEPDDSIANDDDFEESPAAPTQALSVAGLTQLDETSDEDRRQKLLQKLRSKKGNQSRGERSTARGIPAATGSSKTQPDEPAAKMSAPVEPGPKPQGAPAVQTSGPRFAIPKPAAKPAGAAAGFKAADQVKEIAPEAIELLDPFELPDAPADPGDLDQESFVTLENPPSPWDTPGGISETRPVNTAFPIASPGAPSHNPVDHGASLDAPLYPAAAAPPVDLASSSALMNSTPASAAEMPDPEALTSAPPEARTATPSDAKKSIRLVCILLAVLGALVAGLGAVFLSGTAAMISLVGGCVLCICAGLFLLALKWLS